MNTWIRGGFKLADEKHNDKNICLLEPHQRFISRLEEPVTSENWEIFFVGEITNRKQIISELTSSLGKYSQITDKQLFVHCLLEWGFSKSIRTLSGRFSCVAYEKDTDEIHLAIDKLGGKSLFYSLSDDDVLFGSTPALIVEARNLKWSISWQALESYFIYGVINSRSSIFEGINRIFPGEYINIKSSQKTKREKYWLPTVKENTSTLEDKIEQSIVNASKDQQEITILADDFIGRQCLSTVLSNSTSVNRINNIDIYSSSRGKDEWSETVFGLDEDNVVKRYTSSVSSYCEFHGELCPNHAILNYPKADFNPVSIITSQGSNELFCGNTKTPTPELLDEFSGTLNDQIRGLLKSPENFHLPPITKELLSFTCLRNTISEIYWLEGFPASATHRWFELTLNNALLNPLIELFAFKYQISFSMPFLDDKLISLVLSCSADELITEKYGRQTPLISILEKHNAFLNPKLLQASRDVLAFATQNMALEIIFNQSVKKLRAEQILNINPTRGHISKEYYGLARSAYVFDHWREYWVNQGKLVL